MLGCTRPCPRRDIGTAYNEFMLDTKTNKQSKRTIVLGHKLVAGDEHTVAK